MATDPTIQLPTKLDQLKQWSGAFKDITIGGVMIAAMFAGKWAFDEFKAMRSEDYARIEKMRFEDQAHREKAADKFIAADERRQAKMDVVVDKLTDVSRTLGETAREVRRATAAHTAQTPGSGGP